MLIIYSDGLVEPRNPGGVGAWGWAANRDGKEMAYQFGAEMENPTNTNNKFEYLAFIHAVAWVWKFELYGEEILFRTDSQLVIRQLEGKWAVKAESIRPHYERARRGLAPLKNYRLEWVRREQNVRADELANSAYQEHVQKHGQACVAQQMKPRPGFNGGKP